MKKIPDNSYLFITGVIRALESKRIKKETLDKILHSGLQADMEDFFKDTPYSDYIKIHGLNENFNSMLSWRRKSVFEFLEKYSADRDVVKLLKSRYDFHNIRVLLKNKIFEYHDTDSLVDSGSIEKQTLIELFSGEQYSSLPQTMNVAVIASIEAYYQQKKPMMIDAVIDRYLYKYLLGICLKMKSTYIGNYIRLSIDLMNFQIVFRSGAALYNDSDLMNIYIDGGKVPLEEILNISRETDKYAAGIKIAEKYGLIRLVNGISEFRNNIFSIERECDNSLNDYLDKAAFFIWGPEPAVAFGYSVEMEIRILGLVLNSIKNGLPVELIKKEITGAQIMNSEGGSESFAVIGAKDDVLPFLAIGADVFITEDIDEARVALKDYAVKGFSVILITDEIIYQMDDLINKYSSSPVPSIVAIPGRSGDSSYSISKLGLKIKKAIGIDIEGLI